MKRALMAAFVAGALAFSAEAQEKQRFEKSYSLVGDKDVKVGIKVGDVTIDSFRIRNWPDAENFEKAEKDLNDRHTAVVEFTYSNRDLDHDYKCKYVVTIPGCKDDKPCGENDRTATLDKGKVGDTNKMFVKMRTNDFKTAKKINITYEIWKKG